MTYAVVLFGHGARNPAWALPMEAIADNMRTRTSTRVELAYLEFLKPSLIEKCAELAQTGVTHVAVMPVFLAGAGHLMNDLPGILADISQQYPMLKISQKRALGDRVDVISAISQSFLNDMESTLDAP
jgi:sirohydrochlorin cobaltochelatase